MNGILRLRLLVTFLVRVHYFMDYRFLKEFPEIMNQKKTYKTF